MKYVEFQGGREGGEGGAHAIFRIKGETIHGVGAKDLLKFWGVEHCSREFSVLKGMVQDMMYTIGQASHGQANCSFTFSNHLKMVSP